VKVLWAIRVKTAIWWLFASLYWEFNRVLLTNSVYGLGLPSRSTESKSHKDERKPSWSGRLPLC